MTINTITIQGYLVSDLKITNYNGQNGQGQMARFGLSVARPRKDAVTGNYQSDIINCVAFDYALGDIQRQGAVKGCKCIVSGKLQANPAHQDMNTGNQYPLQWEINATAVAVTAPPKNANGANNTGVTNNTGNGNYGVNNTGNGNYGANNMSNVTNNGLPQFDLNGVGNTNGDDDDDNIF